MMMISMAWTDLVMMQYSNIIRIEPFCADWCGTEKISGRFFLSREKKLCSCSGAAVWVSWPACVVAPLRLPRTTGRELNSSVCEAFFKRSERRGK